MDRDIFNQRFDEISEEITKPTRPKRLRDYDVPFLHQVLLMLLSTVVAFMSLVPLHLSELASSLQSHSFYAGWAFTQGQLPYLAVFSRSGLLYSALLSLATQLGGVQWLIPVQLLALYLSGLLIYKLLYYWTGESGLSRRLSSIFYLFQLVLGFGGFYAVQLAMPFILYGLWIVVTYLDELRRDEIFISYGLVSALALSLEPRSLLFFVLAFLVLTVANISRRRWARGFYQNLAIIFGLILVVYPLAYFAVNLEILTPYLQQAFGESFLSIFDVGELVSLGIRVLVLVGSGLLTGLVFLPKVFRQAAQQRTGVTLLVLSTLVYTVVAVFSQSTHFTELLLLVPFGLLLTGLSMSNGQQDLSEHRHSRRRQSAPNRAGFMRRHLYLPLIALAGTMVWSILPLVTEESVNEERQHVASYLVNQTTDQERIYVWDTSTDIYLASQRLSASQLPSPTTYLSSANQQLIVDELLQGKASYVVVNTHLTLPKTLQDKLAKDYQAIQVDQIKEFIIYQIK